MLAGEFVDYKRSPAFWFLFELIIGSDVCANPLLSAKVAPLVNGENQDMLSVIEEGLSIYEMAEKRFRHNNIME